MATAAAEAHVEAQARLRALTAGTVANTWRRLPNYDAPSVPVFLSVVVPLILAAQRSSVALTNAFIARSLGRPPVGIAADAILTGIRGETLPQEVYRRPFVTTWTALQDGRPYADAVSAGLSRATASAEMDVQLAMTHTLRDIGERDPAVLGYARVPDPGACEFCTLIAGQRYRTDQLMPAHNRCGCGVDVITAANRQNFSGVPGNDLSVPGAGVYEHGELGPLVGDPSHEHLSESAALAR